MAFFKCSHPAKSLFVHRDSTVVKRDKDFSDITHHLYCMKCGEQIDISYSMMTKTVKEFLYAGMDKIKKEVIENERN